MLKALKKPTPTKEMLAELNALQAYKPTAEKDDFDDGDWTGAERGVFHFSKRYAVVSELAHHLESDVVEILYQHQTPQDYQKIGNAIRAIYRTA